MNVCVSIYVYIYIQFDSKRKTIQGQPAFIIMTIKCHKILDYQARCVGSHL